MPRIRIERVGSEGDTRRRERVSKRERERERERETYYYMKCNFYIQ